MEINPNIFASLIGALGATIVLLLYFIFIAIMNSSRLKKSEEVSDELKNDAKDIQNKIFLKAQEDYAAIISAADTKAEEIVRNAMSASNSSEEALEKATDDLLKSQYKTLNDKAKDIEGNYENELKEVNNNNIKVFTSVTKDILDYTNKQVEEYKKTLEALTIESRKQAENKANTEYQKIEVELEAYKKEMLDRIDNRIVSLLLAVAKITIGKSLSLADQENLIIDALNQAKKDGALNYKNNK